MTKVELLGSKIEQIETMLRIAGWHEGRRIDIHASETYYNLNNIEMFESVKMFYREFYGIEDSWYIKVENPNWAPDFEFKLFPKCFGYIDKNRDFHQVNYRDLLYDDAEYQVFTEEYKEVNLVAEGDCIIIGSIGYYYPATVWMDKKGNLFATHEYDAIVHNFSSIIELIQYELSKVQVKTVMMKKMCLDEIGDEKVKIVKKYD